jgi:very-short-patch-repair endonuclease
VAEIAGRQHGLITRRELGDLGPTRTMIDNAISRGRLIPVHQGVYAVGHPSLPPLAPFMAAVLAVGRGAVVSHRSAATLWGLIQHTSEPVDITVVGRDAGRRRERIRVHKLATLDPRDATTHHGIPITTSARALLDITPGLTEPELERTFDSALKQRSLTRHAVATTVARYPRRRGAARLAALARAELRTSADTESDTEDRFLELVRAGGLPEPEFNVRLLGRYKVDALWRSHRLVVELDGYAFHSTKWSFETDHERDQVLADAGFAVMRFTRDQIVEQPALVLVRFTRRLAQLEAQSGRSNRMVS